MGRFSLVLLALLTACEQSGTIVDAGAACIARDDFASGDRPGAADISVGEPIPLFVHAGFGCSTRVLFTECTVEVDGDEAIIRSEMDIEVPGRLPWDNQDMCLRVGTAQCDMPPSNEGINRVRYGENVMDISIPGVSEGCISSRAGVTAP